MARYSFAGRSRGTDDPQNIRVMAVNAKADCPIERFKGDMSEPHTIIMWSGGEYSKRNTWISATDEYLIDIEDAR